MVNDPIGDMLIQIKNAAMCGKKTVRLPFSRMKYAVAQTLVSEKYLIDAKKEGVAPKLVLSLGLRFESDKPVLTDVKRRSKPGLRIYVDHQAIPSVLSGLGTTVISTSQGVMSGKEAKKRGIGGELLCEVW